MRYRSLAKVTTRRCRKGFTLLFNPDVHWSAALYKSLHQLQYENDVVKANPIHQKNSEHHYSDLQMLSEMDSLKPLFENKHTHSPKEIDCIRVDGASARQKKKAGE